MNINANTNKNSNSTYIDFNKSLLELLFSDRIILNDQLKYLDTIERSGTMTPLLKYLLLYPKYSYHRHVYGKLNKLLNDTTISGNEQLLDGSTPLIVCAMMNNEYNTIDSIKLLLSHKNINLDIQNNSGKSALMYIANFSRENNGEAIVKLLIDAGAKLDNQDNAGYTALMLATRFCRKESTINTVKMLLDAGANVNICGYLGETPLTIASVLSSDTSSEECVELLLQYGANPYLKNSKGVMAIFIANRYNMIFDKKWKIVGAIKILIDHMFITDKIVNKFKDYTSNEIKDYLYDKLNYCTKHKNHMIKVNETFANNLNDIKFRPESIGNIISLINFDITNSKTIKDIYDNLDQYSEKISLIDFFGIKDEKDMIDKFNAYLE